MTNFEKITQMSSDELSIFLNPRYCTDCVAGDYCDKIPYIDFTSCADTIEKWLETEVE